MSARAAVRERCEQGDSDELHSQSLRGLVQDGGPSGGCEDYSQCDFD